MLGVFRCDLGKTDRVLIMNHAPLERPLLLFRMRLFRALRSRRMITEEDRILYRSAKRGYEGELGFYEFLKGLLPRDALLLHSLSLESGHSNFQIDSLLVNNQSVCLFEVKNFVVDYYIRNHNWYLASSNKEIINPFIQLRRAESLFRQLLSSFDLSYSISSYLVFIHPEFTLYNASMNLPLIFHSQLNRFFHQDFFQKTPYSGEDYKLAERLLQHHKDDSRFEQLPQYTFEGLKKGITCGGCGRFMEELSSRMLMCRFCKAMDSNEEAILRTISDFHLL